MSVTTVPLPATPTGPKILASDAVRSFVHKRGLDPFFHGLVQTTEHIFATASEISCEIHEDPEIEGLQWLLFIAQVPWSSSTQVRAAREAWYNETSGYCPGPVLTEFNISIRRPYERDILKEVTWQPS
jgi:hypothetical protein